MKGTAKSIRFYNDVIHFRASPRKKTNEVLWLFPYYQPHDASANDILGARSSGSLLRTKASALVTFVSEDGATGTDRPGDHDPVFRTCKTRSVTDSFFCECSPTYSVGTSNPPQSTTEEGSEVLPRRGCEAFVLAKRSDPGWYGDEWWKQDRWYDRVTPMLALVGRGIRSSRPVRERSFRHRYSQERDVIFG